MKYKLKAGQIYESTVCEGLICEIRYVTGAVVGITIEAVDDDSIFHEKCLLEKDVCEYLTMLSSRLQEVV